MAHNTIKEAIYIEVVGNKERNMERERCGI
jgi:hypothetical protein